MTVSDDEDESLAQFLESEVLAEDEAMAEVEEEAAEPQPKRLRTEGDQDKSKSAMISRQASSPPLPVRFEPPRMIEAGFFSKIPSELFYNILKFLSSEDLVACSLVCRFLNYAASDESLWRRL